MLKEAITRDEKIKSSIVEAARGLFQQYGLYKTTMGDIARSIGKGKSSLYYYYATKEDLFEAVVLKEKQSIINEVKNAVQKATTAEDKLRTFAITVNKALKERILLFNIIRAEASDDLCLKVFKKKYDTIELDLFRSIISFGIESGEFNNIDKKQLDHITLISVSMLRGLRFNLILEEHDARDIPELINLSIDMLIKAFKS